jgi:hypothetical protein
MIAILLVVICLACAVVAGLVWGPRLIEWGTKVVVEPSQRDTADDR